MREVLKLENISKTYQAKNGEIEALKEQNSSGQHQHQRRQSDLMIRKQLQGQALFLSKAGIAKKYHHHRDAQQQKEGWGIPIFTEFQYCHILISLLPYLQESYLPEQ